MRILVCGAAALALVGSPVAAATQVISGSGYLTGATGVSVRDVRDDGVLSYSTYDVSFEDGTCSSLFGGCDQKSDFALTDASNDGDAAYYGALALLDQVFTGIYDTSPALTYGCGAPSFCQVLIPYQNSGGLMTAVVAFNSPTEDGDGTALGGYSPDFDTTNGPVAFANNSVYARFTLSTPAPVPEPATWAMMLLGFGFMGMGFRRRSLVSASQN